MRGTILAAGGALALVAACEAPHKAPRTAAAPAPQPSEYAAPPALTAAVRSPDGSTLLSGTGPPDALARLASPDGAAIGAASGADGRWRLTAPAADGPRLYSLSDDMPGRLLRARGYLAVLPAPGPPAVVLEPGGPAHTVGPAPEPRIAAVDFDRSGAAVVSGRAKPNQTVRLALDGADAGEDRAGPDGRFSVSLSQALAPGPHALVAVEGHAQAFAAFTAEPAGSIEKPPFHAFRAGAAWRIDWMTPGGGVQSSVVFDPVESAP